MYAHAWCNSSGALRTAGETLRVRTYVGLCVKCPLLLSDPNENWNLSTRFSKTAQCMYNVMHVRSSSLELLHAYGRSDFIGRPAGIRAHINNVVLLFMKPIPCWEEAIKTV